LAFNVWRLAAEGVFAGGVVEWWSGGVVEWWSGGRWSGGVVEWWSAAILLGLKR
jgi:hypothetical protein